MTRLNTLSSLAVLLVGATSFFAVIGCDSGPGEVKILTMEPRVGPLHGEQPIKIGGKNFRTDIGYAVYFGNQKSPQVTILDPNTLMAVAPSGSEPAEVDVQIRVDDGSAFRIVKGYRYEDQGGSVVEQLGSGPAKAKEGALAY